MNTQSIDELQDYLSRNLAAYRERQRKARLFWLSLLAIFAVSLATGVLMALRGCMAAGQSERLPEPTVTLREPMQPGAVRNEGGSIRFSW